MSRDQSSLAIDMGNGRGDPRPQLTGDPEKPLTRFLVRRGAHIVPIMVHQIERIEAARDYVAVYVSGQPSLVYIGMAELVMRLDPDRFVRVHRSHIVNLDYVANITPRGDGRLLITMRDKTPIPASRTGSRVLRERALSR